MKTARDFVVARIQGFDMFGAIGLKFINIERHRIAAA